MHVVGRAEEHGVATGLRRPCRGAKAVPHGPPDSAENGVSLAVAEVVDVTVITQRQAPAFHLEQQCKASRPGARRSSSWTRLPTSLLLRNKFPWLGEQWRSRSCNSSTRSQPCRGATTDLHRSGFSDGHNGSTGADPVYEMVQVSSGCRYRFTRSNYEPVNGSVTISCSASCLNGRVLSHSFLMRASRQTFLDTCSIGDESVGGKLRGDQ